MATRSFRSRAVNTCICTCTFVNGNGYTYMYINIPMTGGSESGALPSLLP